MQITYSEISNYWAKNPCFGGSKDFPFELWKGKKVLEIGAGLGADEDKFIKAGIDYTGIDLTIEKKPHIRKMNAEQLEFSDKTFDLVYSWGVIHHTINPEKVIDEAYRVLKDNGYICIMLYNKPSFRYNIEIMLLRKILWILRDKRYKELRFNNPAPDKRTWISWNTDTLGCPLARVYNNKQAIKLLDGFKITANWIENWGWFRVLIGQK